MEPFDLLTPEAVADPYPLYARMRREPSIRRISPGGMWAVARYDDVMAVLTDPRRFSSAVTEATKRAGVEQNPFQSTMVSMDPPEQTRLRSLVNRAFVTGALARVEARIRTTAGELCAGLARRREVELVNDFTMRLTGAAICEMLGVAPDAYDRLVRWSDDVTRTSVRVHVPREHLRRIRASFQEQTEFFTELIEARRAAPGDDIVSELIRAEIDGETLSQRQLLGFIGLLMVAGMQTPADMISNALVLLARHPEIFARVRADRALVPRLVEEVLRFEPPAQGVIRRAVADTELAGTAIPRNAPLFVILASACRDERQFADPDAIRLDRERPVNLAFGHGVHFCLASALARLEARVALESFFEHVSGFTLKPGPILWKEAITVRGPTALHAVVEPSPSRETMRHRVEEGP